MIRAICIILGLVVFNPVTLLLAQERQSWLRFEPTAIIDHGGFGQPMVAMTLFVPQGWRTEGGVVWGNQHACTNGYAIQWKALAPDQLHGALILPQQSWEFNSNNGPAANINCTIAQIYDVESYLRLLLQEIQPAAQNVTFRHRPDLLTEFPQSQTQKAWEFGIQQSWVETGDLVFEFSQQGVLMQGVLAAAVIFEKTITNTQVFQSEATFARALPAYGTFAPKGQYNPSLFRAIRKSLTPDAFWDQEIAKHNATMNGINLKGFADRAKISADTNREIGEIIRNSWEQQQVSSDRRAREFLEVIRETETWNDTSAAGGQVELSGHYNHAWKLEDGTYILTDQAGFNPLQQLGISGTQLQVAQ